MQITNLKKWLIILSTALWCVIAVLGWKNENYLICLVLSVIIMGCYLILGSANKGIISKKFFIYPLLTWAVVWTAAFCLAAYFADVYAGVKPPLVFGLHPALACIIGGFWFGGLLTILLGWHLHKDEWMSPDDWDAFVQEIQKLDEQAKKGGTQS